MKGLQEMKPAKRMQSKMKDLPAYISRSKAKQAFIIEQFVSGVTIKDLSDINGLDFLQTSEIVKQWYPNGKESITLPSAATLPKEDFIKAKWDCMPVSAICEILGVCKATVINIKHKNYLPKKPKVFSRPLNVYFRSRSIILNEQTGIFYFSCREAGLTISKNEDYIKSRIIKNHAKNNTDFVYCGKL